MKLGEVSYEGKSEAETTRRAVGTARALHEWVEQVGKQGGIDSDAGITHAKHRGIALTRSGYRDGPTRRCIPRRIGEEIVDDLPQAVALILQST